MSLTHLTLEGTWAACDDRACPLLFHVELSIEAAAALPEGMIEQIFEGIQPPDHITPDGTRNWIDENRVSHRDYGLPAVIRPGGTRLWLQHGMRHRSGDKPAVIYLGATRHWYVNDQLHRDGDEPAVIWDDGSVEYWRNNKRWYPTLNAFGVHP